MNKAVYDGSVGSDFEIFHFVVIEVLVKFFCQTESALNQFIASFGGHLLDGVLEFAMASATPIALCRDGDDGMRRGSPQLL